MDERVLAKSAEAVARAPRTEALLVRGGGGRPCALAVSCVIETMRPLPVAQMPAAPRFVRGTAVIRGAPTPVLDLGALLAGDVAAAPRRFVTLRLAVAASPADRVALSVDEVLAVHRFEVDALCLQPGLLSLLDRETIPALRRFDPRLLALVESSFRVLPSDPRAPDEAGQAFA